MNNGKCPPKTVEEQICELYQMLGNLQQRAFLDPANARGEWESTEQYNAGDMVSLDGSSYFAIIASQGYSPALPANIGIYWQPLAGRGEPGEPGGRGITQIYSTGHTVVGNETITDLKVAYTAGEDDEVEVHAQNGTDGVDGKSIASITLNGTAQSDGKTISNERVIFSDGTETSFNVEAKNGAIDGVYIHSISVSVSGFTKVFTLVIYNTTNILYNLSTLRTFLVSNTFSPNYNKSYPLTGAFEQDGEVWRAIGIQAPLDNNLPLNVLLQDEQNTVTTFSILAISDLATKV